MNSPQTILALHLGATLDPVVCRHRWGVAPSDLDGLERRRPEVAVDPTAHRLEVAAVTRLDAQPTGAWSLSKVILHDGKLSSAPSVEAALLEELAAVPKARVVGYRLGFERAVLAARASKLPHAGQMPRLQDARDLQAENPMFTDQPFTDACRATQLPDLDAWLLQNPHTLRPEVWSRRADATLRGHSLLVGLLHLRLEMIEDRLAEADLTATLALLRTQVRFLERRAVLPDGLSQAL